MISLNVPTFFLDQSRSVNRVNEITDITESTGPSWVTPAYDRNGNMTTIPKPADPTASFTATYDACGAEPLDASARVDLRVSCGAP